MTTGAGDEWVIGTALAGVTGLAFGSVTYGLARWRRSERGRRLGLALFVLGLLGILAAVLVIRQST